MTTEAWPEGHRWALERERLRREVEGYVAPDDAGEVLALLEQLMSATAERRRLHEQHIVRAAYGLGRKMARYQVTRTEALATLERLAGQDDHELWYYGHDGKRIYMPHRLAPSGRELAAIALARGVRRGRPAA